MSIQKYCTKNKDSRSKMSYNVSANIHWLKGALSCKYKYNYSKEICKRPLENNLLESVKTVFEPYVVSIMVSMFQAGYYGKTVYMKICSDKHITSISHFLRSESTCDEALASSMKHNTIKLIYDECKASGCSIFFIVNDTIYSKTIPSSKVRNPI